MIGWTGSILMSLCAFPQAVKSWKDGHSDGLDLSFLLMWFVGEVLTLYAVWPFAIGFLLFNYVMNILFLVVILWFKLRSKK